MTEETGTAAELNLQPGDVVEFFSPPYTVARAEEVETDIFGGSVWLDLLGFRSGVFTNEILRIVSRASELKRETVTLYGGSERTGYFAASLGGKLDNDTHRITFDLIDGKPDCASIRMEEL